MKGIPARRVLVMIAIPVVLIAAAVFATATIERDNAIDSGNQQQAAGRLLTSMLDQETGARGYFETAEPAFLTPWYQGRQQFAAALRQAHALMGGDPSLQELLAEQAQLSRSWSASVLTGIEHLRQTGRRPSIATDVSEKSLMDEFRQANALLETQLASRRDTALSHATWRAVGVATGVSLLLVLAAMLLVRGINRRQARRLSRLQELREMLQVSASEKESQLLLIHHVQRTVPGSAAAVLARNNSDDRLEPRFSANVKQTPLRALEIEHLKPRSCMAVRLSRSYVQRRGDTPLVRCEACGRIGADVVCEPLLVGGRVIGSVLVTRERPIDASLHAHVQESVVQAAPILANQRNLALAERRAASDALTGLPNRRAADETLTRMAAQAGRTVAPLSAVLVDLDHFKQVNDLHGHELGDKALAAVGQIFTGTLRASDFASRYGGEEFLLLLPDTDRAGALAVAEKLRRAIERAEIRDLGPLTASFGVATLPDDAAEPEDLVRRADRALYAAKANGRNRVQLAGTEPELGHLAE